MAIDQLFGFFQFHLLLKLFASVLMLFYFVFVVVVYRQISLMTQVLDSKISPLIKTLALAQIVAVGLGFFLVVVLI